MIPDSLVVPAAVAALAFLGWVLLRLVRLTHWGDFIRASRLATFCTTIWMVGLLLVTLGGRPQDANGSVWFNWIPFASHTVANDTDIVMNCLLFVPAGLVLPWIARHAPRSRVVVIALLGSALLSSVIEVLQTFTPLGSAGDLTDILLNTAGCAVAAVISSSVHHWLVSNQPSKAPVDTKAQR